MNIKYFTSLFINFLAIFTIIGCGETKKANNVLKPGVYINKNNVLFVYKAEDKKITNVAITGDFNGWDPKGTPLVFENGVWKISITLEKGIWLYKYILNNSIYIYDPYGLASAPDGKGGRNSIVEIK